MIVVFWNVVDGELVVAVVFSWVVVVVVKLVVLLLVVGFHAVAAVLRIVVLIVVFAESSAIEQSIATKIVEMYKNKRILKITLLMLKNNIDYQL